VFLERQFGVGVEIVSKFDHGLADVVEQLR
jgi:hypothetical protein